MPQALPRVSFGGLEDPEELTARRETMKNAMEALRQREADHQAALGKLKERGKTSKKAEKGFWGSLLCAAAATPMLLVAGGVFKIGAAAAPFFWPILGVVCAVALAYAVSKFIGMRQDASERNRHKMEIRALGKQIDTLAKSQAVEIYVGASPEQRAALMEAADPRTKKLYKKADTQLQESYDTFAIRAIQAVDANRRVGGEQVIADGELQARKSVNRRGQQTLDAQHESSLEVIRHRTEHLKAEADLRSEIGLCHMEQGDQEFSQARGLQARLAAAEARAAAAEARANTAESALAVAGNGGPQLPHIVQQRQQPARIRTL